MFVATDAAGPTAPTDVVAVARADSSIDVTWTASTDDVGVASYRVMRSGTLVVEVPGTEITAHLVGLGLGSHPLQVVAVDTNGNVSVPSATVTVEVASTDAEPPTTPGAPTATFDRPARSSRCRGSLTDNLGVAGYVVREARSICNGSVDRNDGPLTLPAGAQPRDRCP